MKFAIRKCTSSHHAPRQSKGPANHRQFGCTGTQWTSSDCKRRCGMQLHPDTRASLRHHRTRGYCWHHRVSRSSTTGWDSEQGRKKKSKNSDQKGNYGAIVTNLIRISKRQLTDSSRVIKTTTVAPVPTQCLGLAAERNLVRITSGCDTKHGEIR